MGWTGTHGKKNPLEAFAYNDGISKYPSNPDAWKLIAHYHDRTTHRQGKQTHFLLLESPSGERELCTGLYSYYRKEDETLTKVFTTDRLVEWTHIGIPSNKILDLLPIKEGKEETEVPWRETCRKHNAIQKIIRKAVPGTIIRYHQPRKFIDGYEHDTFTLILVPRGRRTIKGLRGKNGGLYTFDPTGIAEIQLPQPEPALKAA